MTSESMLPATTPSSSAPQARWIPVSERLPDGVKHVADRLDSLWLAMRTMPVNEQSFNEIISLVDSLRYVLREEIKNTRRVDVGAMVDRFLRWPLPDSVCSDACVTEAGQPYRTGTNLLTATEARQMLVHVLSLNDAPHIYWLIERASPAEYVAREHYGSVDWTSDPHKAMAFSDFAAARQFIQRTILCVECDLRVCEHMFGCGVSP